MPGHRLRQLLNIAEDPVRDAAVRLFRDQGQAYKVELLEGIEDEASPATAHMFIMSPLSGGGIRSLFSTHPPIEKRIERLRAMRTAAVR